MYWPDDRELANTEEINTMKNLLNHHYATWVVYANGIYANIEENEKVVGCNEE